MFYQVVLSFFPVLLLLTIPLGLGLMAVFVPIGPGDEGDVPRSVLIPLAGLAALVIVLGLALRLGFPATALIYLAAGINGLGLLAFGLARGRQLVSVKDLALVILIAFLGYLALVSPLLSDGRFVVLGYNTNNDPVFHAVIPEYIESNGYLFPDDWQDGFTQAAIDKLDQQGYPDGWHHFLLLARQLFGLRAYHLFNMAVAFFGAFTAFAAFAWARAGGLPRSWAAGGALFATLGYLQLSYAFQGFAPQVAVVPFLYGALFALYRAVIKAERAWLLLAALFIQAGLAVYSFTILLWLGSFLAAALVFVVMRQGAAAGLRAAVIGAGAVSIGLLINPFVLSRLYISLQAVLDFAGGDSLGNLLFAQVPILPLFNVWPVGDHRLLPVGSLNRLSYIPAFAIIGFLAIGLLTKNRRSLWLSGAVAVVLPMVVVKFAAGPYYFAKTLQMAAPLVGLAIVAGVYSLIRSRYRWPAAGLAALLLAGVLVSNLALVQTISRTPADRFDELLEINERFGSGERALFFSRGEDWGAYLLNGFQTAAPLAHTYQGKPPGVRGVKEVYEGVATANDLDDLYSVLSTRFDWLIIDRANDISLPPPPFELAQAGQFYNTYRRVGPPSAALRHLPAEDATDPNSLPFLEVAPGETVRLEAGGPFSSLRVSAYLFPDYLKEKGARPGSVEQAILPSASVGFSAGDRSITVGWGLVPQVQAVALRSDESGVFTVENKSSLPLRLDWFEPFDSANDLDALFRYNRNNKPVFQASERIVD